VPPGKEDVFAGEVLQAAGKQGRCEPFGIEADAEPVEQIDDVGGKTDGDAHVGEGVLENEVPAYDPGDELTEYRVGVGVGGAGDGDHAGELGVAQAGECTYEGDENQRYNQRRASAGTTSECAGGVVDYVDNEVEDRRLPSGIDRRRASDGRADDGEDARADDDADAERGERDGAERLLEAVLRDLGVGDELVDRFSSEDLAGQGSFLVGGGWFGLERL